MPDKTAVPHLLQPGAHIQDKDVLMLSFIPLMKPMLAFQLPMLLDWTEPQVNAP